MMKLVLITVLLLTPALSWADRNDNKTARKHDPGRGSHHSTQQNYFYQWYQPGIEWRGAWFRLPGWQFRQMPEPHGDRGHHSDKVRHKYNQRPAKAVARWKQASRISTRHRQPTRQVIRINRDVAGIGLLGLDRAARVYEARVEFGNGQVVSLDQLEGRISDGDFLSTRFRHPRHVERLILDVGVHRHKPALISVEYLAADDLRGRYP